jgi:hypothetical protein
MNLGQFPTFDIQALYGALDTERRARGISWQQVAREISSRLKSVPARPISPSTLSGMRNRRIVEGDGVLQMLLWLRRTPESFVPGNEAPEENAKLPDVPEAGILRFDTAALYLALDAQRINRGMTWKQVAHEIGGVSPAGLTRLSKGGRTAFPDVMRIVRWLGRPAASFTRLSNW